MYIYYMKHLLVFLLLVSFQLDGQMRSKQKLNFYLQAIAEKMTEEEEIGISLRGAREDLIQYARNKGKRFFPYSGGIAIKLNLSLIHI